MDVDEKKIIRYFKDDPAETVGSTARNTAKMKAAMFGDDALKQLQKEAEAARLLQEQQLRQMEEESRKRVAAMKAQMAARRRQAAAVGHTRAPVAAALAAPALAVENATGRSSAGAITATINDGDIAMPAAMTTAMPTAVAPPAVICGSLTPRKLLCLKQSAGSQSPPLDRPDA